jgi:hypothetical protein
VRPKAWTLSTEESTKSVKYKNGNCRMFAAVMRLVDHICEIHQVSVLLSRRQVERTAFSANDRHSESYEADHQPMGNRTIHCFSCVLRRKRSFGHNSKGTRQNGELDSMRHEEERNSAKIIEDVERYGD